MFKKTAIALLTSSLLIACSEKSASDYLASAQQELEQNKTEAAIISLKNALQQNNQLADARFLLGKIYLEQNLYESAIKELEHALRLNYMPRDIIPLLVEAYHKTESDAALIELNINGLNLIPEQVAQVKLYQLQAHLRLGQTDDAQRIINAVKYLKTDSVFKSLTFVYQALLAEDTNKASTLLDDILNLHPIQPDALKLKALEFLREDKIAQALNIYRHYIEAYPQDYPMVFIFARLLTSVNQTEEAEPVVDRLLEINDEHAELNQLKGLARFNDKDYQAAVLHTEKAILANPNDPAMRLVAGISAYLMKNYEKSHQHISFIAEKLPTSHPALRVLASSQLALGLTVEASETLQTFDEIKLEDKALLSSIGLSLVQKGENQKAKALLDKAPNYENNKLPQLGLLKLSLNDTSGIEDLENALKDIDKTESQTEKTLLIEKALAGAYLNSEQLDKALVLAEQWKLSNNNTIQGYMLAGLVYQQQENIRAAEKEYQQALTIKPNEPSLKQALIELMPSKIEQELNAKYQAYLNLLDSYPAYIPAISQAYLLSTKTNDKTAFIKRIANTYQTEQNNIQLAYLLAKMYANEGMFTKTISILERFLTSEEKSTNYWRVLGQSYIETQAYDKAVNHYQTWYETEPNNKWAILSLIGILEGQKKYQEALTLADEYVAKKGNNIQIQVIQINLHLHNNNIETAQTLYKLLPENFLHTPVVKGLLGRLQFANKQYNQAAENLLTAYQATPNALLANKIYQSFALLGKTAYAYSFLTEHVKTVPNDIQGLTLLATQQISRNKSEAIATYQQVIDLNENNVIAHNNLAFLLASQGQTKQALIHANKAVELAPENINCLDTLGKIELDSGDIESALTHLTKAVNLSKEVNEPVYLNYIEALIANKKYSLAKRKLDEVSFSQAHQAQANKLKSLLPK